MKLFEKSEENEKTLERLAKLESLPSTKEALESEKAEILTKRTAAAAKIRDIERDTGDLTRLQKDIDIFSGHLKAIEERSDGLAKALNEKRAELYRVKLDRESDLNLNRGVLCSTAWPEIDQALTFFRDKLDELRKPGRINTNKRGSVLNIFTEKKHTITSSNAPAILESIHYCQRAVAELEKMKLTPDLDLTRIETLKKGVPRIDVFTEFGGERPMEKGPSSNPRDYLASDGELDWRRKKLNEKFKKLMGR